MQEDYRNSTIHSLFSKQAGTTPNNTALCAVKDSQWERWTYNQVENNSLKIAEFLIREGFKKQDRAVLILENQPHWPVIYLGMMYAGLICVPINPQLHHNEIKSLVSDSGSKILFCSSEIFDKKIKNHFGNMLTHIVVLDSQDTRQGPFISFSEIENITPPSPSPSTGDQNAPASLIYTSGTTGLPKGVLLTHKNICSNYNSILKTKICLPTDNFLSILPLYHTYPFMVNLIVPLLLGAKVTYLPWGFSPADLAKTIKKQKITILVGVPQLFNSLHKGIYEKIKNIPQFLLPSAKPFIKRKLRNKFGKKLRYLVSGGARLQPQIGQSLANLLGIKVIEGYGLTETSPVATLNPPNKIKYGSVGKPIPSVEIRIKNPDAQGIGEILIKGPNVMQGYYKNLKLTQEVIQQGWFYSGDLGYIDKEGYLFITGRKKDVIVLSSGKNIYPEELEAVYNNSGYIKEICILPKLQQKDSGTTETLFAVVVPDLDYFKKQNEHDIRGKIRWEIERLSQNLPGYQHIMGFIVVKEELPRTPLRKIKRYLIREKYLDKQTKPETAKEISEEDRELLNKDTTIKIMDFLTKQTKEPVYLDSHLEIDLGLDSISKVELGSGLENIFPITIDEEFLNKASTVKDVILHISKLIEESAPGEEHKESQKSWENILQEPAGETQYKDIPLKTGFLQKMILTLAKIILSFIFKVFWRLKIDGQDNIPFKGPYILCPNHTSYFDGPLVFCSLSLKKAFNTYFIGQREVFELPLLKWTTRVGNIIPIDPQLNFTEAMQASAFALKKGKSLCVFPEGQRGASGKVETFRKGVGILSKELNIPLIPIYIHGTYQAWPRDRLLPRIYPLKIIFGKPATWQNLLEEGKPANVDDYSNIVNNLKNKVIELSKG